MGRLRFALVGAGRLGTALSLALTHAGATLTAFASGSEASRRRGSGLLGLTAADSIEQLVVAAVTTRVDLLLLAVPDASLAAVAAEIGAVLAAARAASPDGDGAAVGRLVVAHTSGATSIEVLAPCRQAGASTLGFHPLQTFSDPTRGVARLSGCSVAVTAGDPRAAALADLVASAVGAEPFALADEDRVLYHAAAVVASNYLVTLASIAEDLFVRAGLPPDRALPALLPLMQGSVDNLRAQGTVAALTGPLSRGDVATVAAHLDALAREAPADVASYQAMGRATLPLLRSRGELSAATIDALDKLLTSTAAHDARHDPDRPAIKEVPVP